MDFLEHFESYNTDNQFEAFHIGSNIINQNFDFEKINIAIFGVLDDRSAINNKGCASAPDEVRKYLYKLSNVSENIQIADLGNIHPGNTLNDTYFAVSNTIEFLVKKNVIPVLIGGSQDITYANYLAYNKLEQVVNIVSVDSKFDLGNDDDITNENYLTKIIMHQPNNLFNYSNIGYQSYFVDTKELELMDKLFFDVYRLGIFTENIHLAEPVIRDADIISFDISAVRQSDAPANNNTSPNGFYGQQACQLARYAGISDKLSSIGFYEINPQIKDNGQTAHLCAQMIWYFIEGVANRKNDFPVGEKTNYLKYNVTLHEGKDVVNFYKSPKSDRWWMEVPFPQHNKLKYERHLLVPCSYNDYQQACKNELPDKWVKTYNKLI